MYNIGISYRVYPKTVLKLVCYIQEWDTQKNRFYPYGSSVIVDNSENDNICSEEDMFTYNIEPIISNGVATIGGKLYYSKRDWNS